MSSQFTKDTISLLAICVLSLSYYLHHAHEVSSQGRGERVVVSMEVLFLSFPVRDMGIDDPTSVGLKRNQIKSQKLR